MPVKIYFLQNNIVFSLIGNLRLGLQPELYINMYTITFNFEQKGLLPITLSNIDPDQSLLEVALKNDIELHHNCGGVCACSTCHVKITAGLECFTEASEDELDQLDEARDTSLESRLGCQARLTKVPLSGKVEIVIPSWNVNAVREGAGA